MRVNFIYFTNTTYDILPKISLIDKDSFISMVLLRRETIVLIENTAIQPGDHKTLCVYASDQTQVTVMRGQSINLCTNWTAMRSFTYWITQNTSIAVWLTKVFVFICFIVDLDQVSSFMTPTFIPVGILAFLYANQPARHKYPYPSAQTTFSTDAPSFTRTAAN